MIPKLCHNNSAQNLCWLFSLFCITLIHIPIFICLISFLAKPFLDLLAIFSTNTPTSSVLGVGTRTKFIPLPCCGWVAYTPSIIRAGRCTLKFNHDPDLWVYYASKDYHQQYLHKNPNGYCGLRGTGVECRIWTNWVFGNKGRILESGKKVGKNCRPMTSRSFPAFSV